MNRLLSLPLLVCALAAVAGCGGDKDKMAYANVSGMVTFNDKPLEKGTITFATEGRPPTSMDIVNGKYSGQAVVGTNRILISSKKKSAAAAAQTKLSPGEQARIKDVKEKMRTTGDSGDTPLGDDGTMVESLPADWNVNSKESRVVESGAANEFNFDLRGQAK